MEITLEKIELVKDKTGVTYKEAKDALERHDGDEVEAIIDLEEKINNQNDAQSGFAGEVMQKVKELVRKGNVSKITIEKDDEVIANVPVNAGIVGAIIAPWGVVAAAVAAFGFRCKVTIHTNDGEEIDVTEKVKDKASTVVEKGNVAIDYAKEKAPEAVEFVKGKGEEVIGFAKDKAPEAINFVKEKGNDFFKFAKEKLEDKDQDGKPDFFDDVDFTELDNIDKEDK